MPDATPARRVLMGRIVGVFGVDGWVKLESYTDPRPAIGRYRPWLLSLRDTEREIAPLACRAQGKTVIARLPGVEDRDAAEALIGAEIHVPRSALPRPAPGEYYWTDLEGLAVVAVDGTPLGHVSHLFATGANDVLVVRGERERLIPFVLDAVVRRVDLDAGRIEVDWDPDF